MGLGYSILGNILGSPNFGKPAQGAVCMTIACTEGCRREGACPVQNCDASHVLV